MNKQQYKAIVCALPNIEKAKELAAKLLADDQNKQPLIDVLLQMARWKDAQFQKTCKMCERYDKNHPKS